MVPIVSVADERSPDDSPDVAVDTERWRRLAAAVLADQAARGELALTFVDADEIAELNAEYLASSGPTDVLAFPLDDPPPADTSPGGVPALLGDVVVSPAVAAGQFAQHAGSLDDEFALLVVHGILHVLGHDHAEPAETAVMRARELDLLERFHWHGPAPSSFRQHHD